MFFTRCMLVLMSIMPIVSFGAEPELPLNDYPYTVGLDFGVGNPINLGASTTITSGYSTFSYNSDNNNPFPLLYGITLDKNFKINSVYSAALGLSYHYIDSMQVNGDLAQGISQPYYQSSYSYTVQSSVLLVEGKLRRQWQHNFSSYVMAGIGTAWNKAANYSTAVPGYLTVTPDYADKTTTSFSYSLGLGADYALTPRLSLGLAYQFMDLGSVGLGAGTIRGKPVSSELTQSNLTMNTLVAELHYAF